MEGVFLRPQIRPGRGDGVAAAGAVVGARARRCHAADIALIFENPEIARAGLRSEQQGRQRQAPHIILPSVFALT